MALSYPTLGDVLGLQIEKNKPVKCLFILKEEARQCTNPVATTTCNKAHEILQHQVTFHDDEFDQIEKWTTELADFLIHAKHKESAAEKEAYQAKWVNMWVTRAGRHHQVHESSLVKIGHHVLYTSQELVEFSEDESLEDDDLLESPTSTSTPTTTYRSPLLLQGTPSITYRSPPLLQDTPAPEPTETHLLPAPPTSRLLLNHTESSNDEVAEEDDAVVDSNDAATTPETSALGVFMSPSQRMIFQSIVQTVSEFLLAYRMRFSSTSTNDAGHVKKESALEIDMLLRVRVPMFGFLNSVHSFIAIQIVISHIAHTLFGVKFTEALVVLLLGWLLIRLSKPRETQTRKIQA